MEHDTALSGDRDLLLGAAAITDFINSLLDPATQVSKQVVYVWIEQHYIPVRRIGARIITSKRQLRAFFYEPTPAPALSPRRR